MNKKLQISTDGYLFRVMIFLLIASGWGILLKDLIQTKQESLQRDVASAHSRALVSAVTGAASTNKEAIKEPRKKNEFGQTKTVSRATVEALSVNEQVARANAGFAYELFSFVSSDSTQKLIVQAKGFLIKNGRTRVSERVTQVFGQLLSQLRSQKKSLSYTLDYGQEVDAADVTLIRNYFSTFYGIKLQERAGVQNSEFSLIVEVEP